MSLVEIIWNPSDRQLRQFGLVALVALPLAGWVWGGVGTGVFCGTLAAGAVAAVVGLVCPRLLKPFFLALSLAAAPIGLVVSELAMLLIFVGVFLPIGVVIRLLGRDPLSRQLDRQAASYWEPKKPPAGPASYLRQW
ncbi:MAG: SxtJ family membrane protein [Thermoguttaceae bacterium]|jgi:hypothetical protein